MTFVGRQRPLPFEDARYAGTKHVGEQRIAEAEIRRFVKGATCLHGFGLGISALVFSTDLAIGAHWSRWVIATNGLALGLASVSLWLATWRFFFPSHFGCHRGQISSPWLLRLAAVHGARGSGWRTVTPASHVFGLGRVLFECVTGRHSGSDKEASKLPARCACFCNVMLNPNPRHRPTDLNIAEFFRWP